MHEHAGRQAGSQPKRHEQQGTKFEDKRVMHACRQERRRDTQTREEEEGHP